MRIFYTLILFIAFALTACNQSSSTSEMEANAGSEKLKAFENLIGSKWLVDTQWGSGQAFKQEVEFNWELNKSAIRATTYGTVNQETGEYGLRNEGFRVYDSEKQQLRFYEFDVFGTVTEGTIKTEGDNIYYIYEYSADGSEIQTFQDAWIKKDNDTYAYTVGVIDDNHAYTQKYLEAEFKRVN